MEQPDPENKPARLPRWTRQEILVLIQGKRVAESRVGRGRVIGPGQPVEPKWATVSGYCKRHGVNRGPVQCRKRWSNLAGDYKKIKEWESKDPLESYWVMRNDLRRERKLPGFFDKEVYDILETQSQSGTLLTASPGTTLGLVLALGPCSTNTEEMATAEEEDEEAEAETVFFDSGRSATAEDGMFSDSEAPEEEAAGGKEQMSPLHDIPAPVPISQRRDQEFTKGPSSEGTKVGKEDGPNPEMGNTSREGRKRKRSSADGLDEDTNTLQHQLIGVLEKNSEMLSAHLQSQNTNSQLDREQRKDHVDSLVAVLDKLADALVKIADKL